MLALQESVAYRSEKQSILSHPVFQVSFFLLPSLFSVSEQCRQTGEAARFADLLGRVRNDSVTEGDYQTLMTRARSDLSAEEISKFDDSLFLVDKKETECVFNNQKLTEVPGAVCCMKCIGSGSQGLIAPSTSASGLQQLLRLKREANLSTGHGLVNGATGIVRKILYDLASQTQGPPSLPSAVVVEFLQYNGPAWDVRQP